MIGDEKRLLGFYKDNPTADLTIADIADIFHTEYAGAYRLANLLSDRGLIEKQGDTYTLAKQGVTNET